MLRLARSPSSGWLALQLHTRTPFWTRDLALALALALFLHILPLGLFRLHRPSHHVVDATQHLTLTTDIGHRASPEGHFPTKERDQAGLLVRQTLEPTRLKPSLPRTSAPQTDAYTLPRLPSRTARTVAVPDPDYTPVPMWSLFAVPYIPMRILATGELSNIEVPASHPWTEPKERTGPTQQSRTILFAQLDCRSGRVYDLRLIESSGDSTLDLKAHQLANQLSCLPAREGLTAEGTVEFHWELTSRDREVLLHD